MNSTTPSRGSSGSTEPIRVLFVDTDEATTQATTAVLEDEFGFDVTVAPRTEDVGRSIESVDCVVHRSHPPIFQSRDVLEDVHLSSPDLPYIVFSEIRATDLAGDALSAGASDFLRADPDDAGYRALASRVATAVSGGSGAGTERATEQYGGVREASSVLDGSLRFVAVSTSYAELHGYEPEGLIDEPWTTVLAGGEAKSLEDPIRRLRPGDGVLEEVVARRRDGHTFPAFVSLTRQTDEQFVCTAVDRRRPPDVRAREHARATIGLERAIVRLETLFTTRFEEDEIGALCEAIVETIANGNESAAVAVYLYDERSDSLQRRAATARISESATTVSLDGEPTPVWNAFVEHEPVFVSSLRPHPDDPVEDSDAACGLVVPVGTDGVLVAGTLDGPQPRPIDHAFVRLVGATAGRILDRVAVKRQLKSSEGQLAEQRVTIAKLDRAVDLIRAIGRVIGETWTRTELENRICEQIVSSEQYTFARIAAFDEVSDEIRDRSWAGSEKRYLESLDADVRSLVDQREPMACAIETLEPCVCRGLPTESIDERWRQDAVTRGYRSVIGVPLVFRERSYGGLAVYSTESGAFDETESELFEELGGWIAHALHAIETRTALIGSGGVELEFRISDRNVEFLEWSRETGCRFEFETVVSRPDGSVRSFFTIEDAPVETILERASRSASITDVGLVTKRGGKHLFECTVTEDSLVARLLQYGAVPQSFSTSEAAGHLVVSLPERTSVREFVDFFTRLYPDSTLVRRRDREFVARSGFGFRSELEETLTEKQLEALETAFVSGYFDVPRETTGDEVASILGISQPTFNTHLRIAQRTLLSMVFSDDTDRAE